MQKTVGALALIAALAAGSAFAQSTDLAGLSKADLRTRQLALFDQMRAAPDSVPLMLDYAAVSAALEDYEATISTLERLLIFRPDLTRAKVELGVAYFRLGSYSVSEYYFDKALEDPDLPAGLRNTIGEFKTAIENRSSPHTFFASAAAGLVYASNANLGPSSETIVFQGNPNVILPASATAQDDVGVRLVLNGTHLYDLGRPNGDVWKTDASFFATRFLEEEDGNYESLFLRSGPVLKLTDEAFGPAIRPFAEGELARSDDQTLFRAIGAGAEATAPLDDQYSLFGSLKVVERQYFDGNRDFDGFTTTGLSGLAYAPTDTLVLRAAMIFEIGRAAEEFNNFAELGGRLSASYRYPSGLSFVERDWRVDGFVEISRRLYDQPNPAIEPDRRRQETEFRLGMNHTFFLFDNLFGQLTVDYVNRKANIVNFDLDGVTVAASIGREF